ncbi:MAG: hypothetical protein ACRDQJ_13620 [Pseudonocardiaceae bacterium]
MESRAVQVVLTEIGYGFRMLFATIPSLRASAEQRSDFELYKAQLFEAWAAVAPSCAAQALQQADKAKREAHAINLDY